MVNMEATEDMELHVGVSPSVKCQLSNKPPAAPIKSSNSAKDIHEEDKSPRSVFHEYSTTTTATATTTTTTMTYTEPCLSPRSLAAAAGERDGSLWKGLMQTWRSRTMRRLASIPPLATRRVSLRRMVSARSSSWRCAAAAAEAQAADGFCVLKPTFRNFSLSELKKATRNFSQENIIGKGGYAKVYKGCLEGGQLVAVKKLTMAQDSERMNNFLSELGNILNVNHPNIAKLVGVGVEGGEHLVFPFSQLGCLLSNLHLHGSQHETMPWEARYKVALGTAHGLEYLHERCARRIIHRDVKAANILLKDDYEPLICDFGLAKWLPAKLTHHQVTVFEGSFGYVPPEYTTHGIFNEKTDVFAYGVVLLELITGRRALDSSKLSLVTWVKPFLDDKVEISKIIDPALGGMYSMDQVTNVGWVAKLCVQHSATLRPQMSQVVKILREERCSHDNNMYKRIHSVELQDADDYNATRHLSDMIRHRALIR